MNTAFPTLMPTIEVLVRRVNGDSETEMFHTLQQARSFCCEEVKWESTARVVCSAIGFDQRGDFASKEAA